MLYVLDLYDYPSSNNIVIGKRSNLLLPFCLQKKSHDVLLVLLGFHSVSLHLSKDKFIYTFFWFSE